jgi:hypothetical protein
MSMEGQLGDRCRGGGATESLQFARILAGQRARPYLHEMRTRVNAAIDIRLADLMVALARRQWPALRIVPQRWIRPVLVPAARRLRRGITAAALIATATAGVIIALLAMPS